MSERPTDQAQAFGGVLDVLEAVGAHYAVWGGLAVVAYGEPRFTQDMDVLLRGDSFSRGPFVRRLGESHYHVDGRAVASAAVGGGFFNVIHPHYAIKVDFYIPTDAERDLRAMIDERVYLPFDEMRRVAYVTATSVVAAKLRAWLDSGSTRHLDDIAGIIRVQGRRLDERRLDAVAARLGAYGVWRALWENYGNDR